MGRTCPLELNIRPYGDVLIRSAGGVLNTSVGDVPWRYMWRQYGAVLRTSYFNVLRTSAEDNLRMSIGNVPWRYIEDNKGTSIRSFLTKTSGRPRDVILPSGFEVRVVTHEELPPINLLNS